MDNNDAQLIADTFGEIIAGERRAMRAEIAAAKAALLAEVRALVAEAKSDLQSRIIDILTSDDRGGDRAKVLSLPARRSA